MLALKERRNVSFEGA